MNEPIRYNLNTVVGIVDEDECGKYVLHSDYARLKAEVERLTAELSNISAWGRGLESDLSHARVEISFLKAEVERLTKLCQATSPDGFIHIRDINAAKEGKPSV